MPNIFGADISGQIARALGPLVFEQTLIKVTENRDQTDPTNMIPIETPFICRGFIDVYKDDQVDGTLVLSSDRKIVIIGDTIENNEKPEPGDKIIAEGKTYIIVPNGIKRDPAGATYECQSR